jgi:hypothetical protein
MSTINYTYNVIVDRFRQFAAGHFQLRRFTHGEISQADLEKEAEWPWLHVKPRAINYAPGTRSFSFEIFISDLPRDKEDKTGYQAESITDCSLIFQDLINEIYLGNMFGDQVVLSRPVNSEPFVEQYTHTLTGVTGTIELNLDYDWSACSIPASWNYNTPTDSPSDGWGALQFIESLDQNGVFVSLLNDEEAPGNSYYYGTDAEGVKGWHAIEAGGLTCETLPECATIISILEDIEALQTDVALKANTADLGATAFSNSYNDLDNLPTIPAAQIQSDWNQSNNVALDFIKNKPTIPSIAGLVPETRTISTTSPLSGGGNLTSDRTLSIAQANTSTNGFLTSTDWNTFNGKQAALGFTPENTANKQNSLAVDGTGVKFPTVDTVNSALSTRSSKIINIITPSPAHTGTTVETQITSFNFTIPANTYSAADILKIETISWQKTGVLNASSCRLKLSNTNTYGTASNVLILSASGGNINMRGTRTYKIEGGNLKGFMSAAANGIYNDNTLTNIATSTLALDFTQPIYGFVSLQLTNAGDSVVMNELIISK